MNNRFALVLPVLFCLLMSCQTRSIENEEGLQGVVLEHIRETLTRTTPLKDNPVFLNYSGLTKGTVDEVPFLDILDTLAAVTTKERGYSILQIPFIPALDYREVIVTDSLVVSEDPWTLSRKFFVSVTDNSTGEARAEIVTMIPTPSVLELYGPHSFDYINREFFDGFIIHSDLDGNQLLVTHSFCGPVLEGRLNFDVATDKADMWIIIPGVAHTKSSDEELTPSICIAYSNIEETASQEANPIFFDQGSPADNNHGQGHNDMIEGGGGGGNEVLDPFLYNVTVVITGNGEVEGTGAYSKNYNATIKARGLMGSHFVRWAGDFFGRDTCFVYQVSKDVHSTALFQQVNSCYDNETSINAVINSRNLAATSNGNAEAGIFTGADYGWTRNGGRKFHKGVDFAATEGTPIFAPYDGEITRIVSDIAEGEFNENTCNYGQSSWNAGNRIWLKCRINGSDVLFKYFHLRSPEHGGGIANGLSVGSRVTGGQLIGYTGQTGNAQGVDIKHLHLETWINGSSTDPWSYINGEIDLQNGLIINVHCDREYISNPDDNYAQLLFSLPGLINEH